MALLINKKMRLLKLNWILFWILKMLNPLFKIVRFAQQVLRDVLKGNWSTAKNNLKLYKWYQRKKARKMVLKRRRNVVLTAIRS